VIRPVCGNLADVFGTLCRDPRLLLTAVALAILSVTGITDLFYVSWLFCLGLVIIVARIKWEGMDAKHTARSEL
jgi:hypothetical protein